ncbi:MAG: zinc-binding dehydrogenase [Chloroflexi bacterium]|nr:zinc-binding dehydrogenase [Chloroflexota bacterium]
MLAVRIHGKLDMRVDDLPPLPDPGPGEVLLRPAMIGICGSDTHRYVEGGMGKRKILSPHIPGHEFAAVVEAVGPDVTWIAPGARVAVEPARPCHHCEMCLQGKHHLCPTLKMLGSYPVPGSLVERMLYPATRELLIPLPDSMSLEEGAMLEPLGVAMHALELRRLRLADDVAVLGSGTIGLLIAQLARLAGASRIICTDPLDYRLEWAERMGATHVINPKKSDVVKQVQEITGGRGVDVVYDASAAQKAYYQAVEIARPGATFVMVGIPEAADVHLPFTEAWQRELTVIFQKRMNDIYPRAMKLVSGGQVEVKSMVTHQFPITEAVRAFDVASRYLDGAIKAAVTTE